jgi:membrane protein implicated in regulation of membrane protease activity
MKRPGIFFLVLTSILLILAVIFSALNLPFPLVFYLVCFGELLLIITVYKVLTDDYKPNMDFEEFYEKKTGDTKK